MLKLLQSIFSGGEQRGRYPESLIEMAIERAVDGTDPRVRALFGYKKQLRPAVIHAIDQVVALVDGMPAPVPAGRGDYSSDPRLTAMFASADHLLEVFGSDTSIRQFRDSPAGGAERITALLLMERVEKNVLGIDLVDDQVRREVAQVAVNFHAHRLIEPAASEEDTRRQLKRRAFDYLLTLALTRITEVKGERDALARQRDLLQHKLRALERGGWTFAAVEGALPDPEKLNTELQEIETGLEKLGTDAGSLQAHLDIVADLLGDAERQLWVEDIVLYLDRMNIQRDAQTPSAQRIPLQELCNARGRRLAMLLVSLAPGELPRREDMIAAAERYLR